VVIEEWECELTFMSDDFLRMMAEEYMVLDGGLGTLLHAKGLSSGEIPEDWNISNPEIVKNIHLEYFIAGSQIIETNTFGASALKLAANEKQGQLIEFNVRGVELARAALKEFRDIYRVPDNSRYVSGSVGPTGKIFEMEVDRQKVEENYLEQGSILAEAGIDLFTVETMMDLREAEVAVKALKKVARLPVLVSMVFNKTKKGEFRTLFGDSVNDAVVRLIEAGADGVGTNCGLVEEYVDVIREMRNLTNIPLLLYPNAGLPKLKGGITVFEQTPGQLIAYLDESISAGATIIGGCCGTTPEYIKLVSERIKGKKRLPV
jgi:5-methyltetrahydrofolate--homocysteine methyltransferase